MGTTGDAVLRWHCACVFLGMKPSLLWEPVAMTTIFAFVGERRDDPLELLLLGNDRQHYAYALPDGPVRPVAPDETWQVDPSAPPVEELLA